MRNPHPPIIKLRMILRPCIIRSNGHGLSTWATPIVLTFLRPSLLLGSLSLLCRSSCFTYLPCRLRRPIGATHMILTATTTAIHMAMQGKVKHKSLMVKVILFLCYHCIKMYGILIVLNGCYYFHYNIHRFRSNI